MKKIGIELEFFIKNSDEYVPAYKYTTNIDGNPVVGELKTDIHDNIVDCIYDLKKRIFLEKTKLAEIGITLELIPEIEVSEEFVKSLRKDENFVNSKHFEVLKELSIYGKKTSKILPRKKYKAALQINISDNKSFSYHVYEKNQINEEYEYTSKIKERQYSSIFDYVSIIRNLDILFKKEIKDTKRIPGVYCIKDGELGKRIEYRSLPNNVDINTLLKIEF
jgi:hypothetical protein